MGKLDGKVVLITGAARGQGRSHALMLAAEGADIIAIDLGRRADTTTYDLATADDLVETVTAVRALGRRAFSGYADIRDLESLSAVVSAGVAELGRLDVVVANAGIGGLNGAGSVATTTPAAWRESIDVNLTGSWNTVKSCLPHLSRDGGASIAFVATSMVNRPRANASHYLAAKSGVVSLMQVLAIELGPERIRVNCLLPGNVDTEMIQNDQTRRKYMANLENPTREDAERPGSPYYQAHLLPVPWIDPSDVSNALIFLASDNARYITGVSLPIDAGYWLR